jgi:hypothetical protein
VVALTLGTRRLMFYMDFFLVGNAMIWDKMAYMLIVRLCLLVSKS